MSRPLSTRACGLRPWQVSWLPGLPLRAFPVRRRRTGGCARLRTAVGIPGHSGGSAPDLHRLPLTTDRLDVRILPHARRQPRSGATAATASPPPAAGAPCLRQRPEVHALVAQRRATGLIELATIRDQAPGVIEVIGAPERQRRLHDAVLQVPVGEAPLLQRSA